ncbi:hypothetical protein [Flavisphingomonas formosensis]|uniref:hypothetical protein n=1 Tax=Flavisphingomonas formosensis TaxID=861534 RepID=UPI0012FB663B|nr:hypothetical protein [Sphingomonas formosensis]
MHVDYCITGSFPVPKGTRPREGVANQFVLPSGEVIAVYPVIEMASAADADDHRDLTWDEADAYGIALELYERACTLEESD